MAHAVVRALDSRIARALHHAIARTLHRAQARNLQLAHAHARALAHAHVSDVAIGHDSIARSARGNAVKPPAGVPRRCGVQRSGRIIHTQCLSVGLAPIGCRCSCHSLSQGACPCAQLDVGDDAELVVNAAVAPCRR